MGNPVRFLRKVLENQVENAYNRVQIENEFGDLVSASAPFNVSIERNRNTNNTAIQTSIILNDLTAIKIADANPDRMYFEVNIDGIMGVNSIFIKTQAASVDNIKQGLWIGNQGGIFQISWRMSEGSRYTGEISAITDTGNVTVFVTEW